MTAPSSWVSVRKALPLRAGRSDLPGEPVLARVRFRGGAVEVFLAFYNWEDGAWFVADLRGGQQLRGVAHWQAAPSANLK